MAAGLLAAVVDTSITCHVVYMADCLGGNSLVSRSSAFLYFGMPGQQLLSALPQTVGRIPSRQPLRRTQAERVAESDQRILASAVHLVATQGCAAVTFESVARGAGYSRQLVAQRFRSTDSLLAAIIHRHIEVLEHRMTQARAGLCGLEALFSEIDSYLHALDAPSIDSRAFFVLMLESTGPLQEHRPLFASIAAGWEQTLAGYIEQGQLAGAFRRDVDPYTEARLLIACLRGIRIQSMLDPATGDVSASIAALKTRLCRQLLIDGARSMRREANGGRPSASAGRK